MKHKTDKTKGKRNQIHNHSWKLEFGDFLFQLWLLEHLSKKSTDIEGPNSPVNHFDLINIYRTQRSTIIEHRVFFWCPVTYQDRLYTGHETSLNNFQRFGNCFKQYIPE